MNLQLFVKQQTDMIPTPVLVFYCQQCQVLTYVYQIHS